ncbi:P-loop containing nucleoside triphosphate hydrolase protein [Cladochytrium replicatum]|nr:P-loop containing nucleoside triphosphate hydrolase protein [Cladochytrium replicatum]
MDNHPSGGESTPLHSTNDHHDPGADPKKILTPADHEESVRTDSKKRSLLTRILNRRDALEKPKPPPSVPYRTLFRFATVFDWCLIALATVMSVVAGLGVPLVTLFYGDLINAIIFYPLTKDKDKLETEVNKTALALFIIGLCVMIASYLHVCCWQLTSEAQIKRIRTAYASALLRQEMGWYDGQESGDLTTRLTVDVGAMQEGMSNKIGIIMQSIVTFVASYIVALYRSWKLTLVSTAILPAFIGVAAVAISQMTASKATSSGAYGAAGAVAQQALRAIRTVTSFNGQEREAARYYDNLLIARAAGVKKGFISGVNIGLFNGLIYVLYAFIFWYGGTRVIAEELTGGGVFNVFLSLFLGGISLGNAVPGVNAISTARGAAYKVFEVIDRVSAIDPLSDDGIVGDHKLTGDIELTDVVFHYPSRPDVQILHRLSLRIPAGKTVALVGASGSGKSTIVSLVERFYDPISGTVKIDGKDLREYNVNYLRRNIGVVSQEPSLFDRTVRENILFGLSDIEKEKYASNGNKGEEDLNALIEQACRMANVWDFIQTLPEKLETNIAMTTVSGGQKQRIAIARALISDPPILLLDEATSALDSTSEAIVQEALDAASRGRTTVVIAHRLSTVRDADLIVVLREGRVIEMGTHDELLSQHGGYYDLAQAQAIHVSEDIPGEVSTEASPRKSNEIKELVSLSDEKKVVSEKQETKLQIDSEMGTELEEVKKSANDALKKSRTPLFRVLALGAPETPLILLGLIGCSVAGVASPIFSIYFSEILQTFAKTGDELSNGVRLYSLVFLAIGVGLFLAIFFREGMLTYAGENITLRLRDRAFRSLLRQEIGFFDDRLNSPGILTSRIGEDARQVQGLVGPLFGVMFQLSCAIAVSLGLALSYQWELTLVVVAALPAVALSGVLEFQILAKFSEKKKKMFDIAVKSISDGVVVVRTVASLALERHLIQEFECASEGPYKLAIQSAFVSPIGFGFSQGVIDWAFALAFWYGSRVMIWERATADQVLKALFTVILSGFSVADAIQNLPDIAEAKVAAISLFRMIDRKSRIDFASHDGNSVPDGQGKIGFHSVEFTYPTRPDTAILQLIDFAAASGTTIALVGPSGSGKSSCISLAERFYDVDGGRVNMDDLDVREWEVGRLRETMALVGQEPVIFNLSIWDNIAYGAVVNDGAFVSDDEVQAAARMANIHDFVMGLPDGYKTVVGEGGGQLSGGQKQRVAIARALIRKPKLLLLDEATSALDSESERVVQAALDAASKDRTTVVIAHRLSTIQNADKIVVIRGGKVVEVGNHEELVGRKGLYFELVTQQSLGTGTSSATIC